MTPALIASQDLQSVLRQTQQHHQSAQLPPPRLMELGIAEPAPIKKITWSVILTVSQATYILVELRQTAHLVPGPHHWKR